MGFDRVWGSGLVEYVSCVSEGMEMGMGMGMGDRIERGIWREGLLACLLAWEVGR